MFAFELALAKAEAVALRFNTVQVESPVRDISRLLGCFYGDMEPHEA